MARWGLGLGMSVAAAVLAAAPARAQVETVGSGRVARREGSLVLDVGGGRSFTVQSEDAPGGAPPEDQDLAIVAALTDPRSPDRVVVREWKSKEQMKSQP